MTIHSRSEKSQLEALKQLAQLTSDGGTCILYGKDRQETIYSCITFLFRSESVKCMQGEGAESHEGVPFLR